MAQSAWIPATHMADLGGAPSSWPLPDQPDHLGHLGMNQQVEELFLSLPLFITLPLK